MESFAEHYGQWHDYFQSYTWQRLSTATKYYRFKVSNAHNALADAISTLEVIRHMAFDEDKPQRRQSYEME
jgi:exonuclease I